MSQLAVLGGPKACPESFPKWPQWNQRELDYLSDALDSGYWGLDSKIIEEWEARFARLQSARFATSITNGTVSLMVALRALGIGRGDEVIVPSYTFMATVAAVLWCHAIPVFADIQPDTFNLDPESVRACISERTRAIMVVHIAGCPCEMDAFRSIAEEHHLALIEDAAQAHGAVWKGQGIGSIGDIGSFSFQSSKNLSAGEGGMLVTNRKDLWERCVSLKNCGRRPGGAEYDHYTLGSNFRMTAFQAAVLLAQAERFEAQFVQRENNWRYLQSAITDLPGIQLQARDPRIDCHALHLLILRYDAQAFGGLPRAEFMRAMEAEGIICRPGYKQLHLERGFLEDAQLFLKDQSLPDYQTLDLPNTRKVCEETSVWIRQNCLLGETTQYVEMIADAIRKIRRNVGELL
jgi:dTDP-4-amino-4,6-dideoxygalactose transaminase